MDASGLIVERTADAIFQELSQFWSKSPWTDPTTDRRAFDAALQRGVSPMRILEGGRSWAAAYSGPDGAPDAPHYLPGLAKWLAADKFLRKPPVRKRDVAAAFFKIGRIKDSASIDDNRARYREILAEDTGEGEEIVKRFEKEVWPHIRRLYEPSARDIAWRLGMMVRTIGSNDVGSQSPLGYAREMLHRIIPMSPACYVLEDACQEFERDWKELPKVPDMVNIIVKHFDRWEARWRPLRGD